MSKIINNSPLICPLLIDRIRVKQKEILSWLETKEQAHDLPLYSSVDIRDAGFKIAVVDTNLFPAGFNNLCEHGLKESAQIMKNAIQRRIPRGREILIVAEEHTRNTWYLENLRILEHIINESGYRTKIATFLNIEPSFCETTHYVELLTATGAPVKIYCFKKLLNDIQKENAHFDMIILNNDLIGGIPEILKEAHIPIYPSAEAGWHSRHKSRHFQHTQELMTEFAALLDLDPWFFSCLFDIAGQIDINSEADRLRLRDQVATLFHKIALKYKEHRISEKPYVIVKADAGTYGMGVIPIEDADEILHLNRKDRNRLHKGKGATLISQFLLQEGVPSMCYVGQLAGEMVIYSIENNLIGGFYRLNSGKSNRENLNAKGMEFKKMCPQKPEFGDCCLHHDLNSFDIYRILARIAVIAAQLEIINLEAHQP